MENNDATSADELGSGRPDSTDRTTPEDKALADLEFPANTDHNQQESAPPDGLREALAEADARVLRAQAELENFRKRMRRERTEELKYAALPLLRDLLPVIDNLQRAILAVDDGQSAAGLVEGVKMVLLQLSGVLEQHHCSEIAAAGQPFDPMSHEAVAQQPSDETAPGNVIEVLQTGYRLHDRVIRPAQVIVSQDCSE